MKKILLSFLLFASASDIFAGGFQLNLQGVQQLAMGGSGTAHPWDVSTIFYNPAGLSGIGNIQAYGNISFLTPEVQYAPANVGGSSFKTDRHWFTPFNLYVGGPWKENSKLGLGLGVYTPFGSGTKWPDDWTGRYLSREIALQSVFTQPTVSYRLNKTISIGIGFLYAYGNLTLRQALPVQFLNGDDGAIRLSGSGNGLGFNAGIQLRPVKNLDIGITYRSKVKMKLQSGDATFDVPTSLRTAFPDTRFSTALSLPEVLSFGLAYAFSGGLTLQADLNYVGWKSYDTLKFDYLDNTPQLQDTHTPRLYQNVLAIRLGAHYSFSDKWEGMLGAAYDPSPVRDRYVSPELPDANRMAGSLGLNYKPVSQVKIMLAIELVSSAKRQATFAPGNFGGIYQSRAFNGAIGAYYNF